MVRLTAVRIRHMYQHFLSVISMFVMAVVAGAFISQGGDSLAMIRTSIPDIGTPTAVPQKQEQMSKVPDPGSRTSWAKLHNLGIALAKSGKLQESTEELYKA